ncbi:MAG: HAMP domain-containing protein, partial [Acetobacteraceae bacterium]
MNRLWPRTLISQMILILLAGLVVSHLVAAWLYTADRARAVRQIGGYAAAQRIANLARLIDEAPPEWRTRLIAAAADPRMRIGLSTRPPVVARQEEDISDLPIRTYLDEQMPPALAAGMAVTIASPGPRLRSPMDAHRPSDAGETRARPPLGGHPWRRLVVTVRLADGPYLTFSVGLPDIRPPLNWPFLVPLGAMAVIVVLASIWAVRRVTAPLGVVTRAAEQLGRNVNAPPIPETGPREMQQAAHAFNGMQARLQRLLRNRTTMLAALSHDLRTPLTLLRLRIEALSDSEERERMLASIATLDA